jgi:hypothetical protein
MGYYVIKFFADEEFYTSKPIWASSEDDATEKLIDQFFGYEGIEPQIISVGKI